MWFMGSDQVVVYSNCLDAYAVFGHASGERGEVFFPIEIQNHYEKIYHDQMADQVFHYGVNLIIS